VTEPRADDVRLDAGLEQAHRGGVAEAVRRDVPALAITIASDEVPGMPPHELVDPEPRERLALGVRVFDGLLTCGKGQRLGIFHPREHGDAAERSREPPPGEVFAVELLGRQVPAMNTEEGVRASAGGKPADPQSVRRYLESKFGADLASAREAMEALAGSLEPAELAVKAYPLYEQFRPVVPQGTKGWGKEGELDLDLLASLARSKS